MKLTLKTNLNCQKCVSSVRPLLDSQSEIRSWNVDTSLPDKLLTIEASPELDSAVVVDLVRQAGYIAQPIGGESPGLPVVDPETSRKPFVWSTYRPLALVLTYVAGLTLLLEYLQAGIDPHRAMRAFMGFFFLGFAFFKLLDVGKFADAFSTYDIVAKRSRAYAVGYPWIEVCLGLAFLLNVTPIVTNLATVALMGVGLVGVVAAVRKRQAIQCACLGTAFNLPMSVVTIVENSAMITMALIGLAWTIY